MTDTTNQNVQEDKKDTVSPVTTAGAVSGEEKKVEAENTPATETKVEEKKAE